MINIAYYSNQALKLTEKEERPSEEKKDYNVYCICHVYVHDFQQS